MKEMVQYLIDLMHKLEDIQREKFFKKYKMKKAVKDAKKKILSCTDKDSYTARDLISFAQLAQTGKVYQLDMEESVAIKYNLKDFPMVMSLYCRLYLQKDDSFLHIMTKANIVDMTDDGDIDMIWEFSKSPKYEDSTGSFKRYTTRLNSIQSKVIIHKGLTSKLAEKTYLVIKNTFVIGIESLFDNIKAKYGLE